MYKDKLPSLISIIDKKPVPIIIFDKTILVFNLKHIYLLIIYIDN